jgi:hypothetical protein
MTRSCTAISKTDTGGELDLARLHVYRFLSLVLSDPASDRYRRLADRQLQDVALAAAEYISR